MPTSVTDLSGSYDFVVIGGGTSGLTVANRLSEDSHAQILVLEAGEYHLNDPRVMIPALCTQAPGSELDWQFLTVPQVDMSPELLLAVFDDFLLAFLDRHRCMGQAWQ